MKNFLKTTALFLFIVLQARAQFMVINHPKGYAVIKDTYFKKAIDTIPNGYVVYAKESDVQGMNIVFQETKQEPWQNFATIGYLSSDDALPIEAYSTLLPTAHLFGNTLVKESGKTKVTIEQKPFDEQENKYEWRDGGDYKHPVINDRSYFGVTGKPTLQFAEITIRVGETICTIPKQWMNDLYDPNLKKTSCYYEADKNRVYLICSLGLLRDYQLAKVIWVIENGKVKQRLLLSPAFEKP